MRRLRRVLFMLFATAAVASAGACTDRATAAADAITSDTASDVAQQMEGTLDQEIAALRKSLPRPTPYVEPGMPGTALLPSVSAAARATSRQQCQGQLDSCVRACDPSCSASFGSVTCRILAPSPGVASSGPLTGDQQRKLACVSSCTSSNAGCR